ncbi:MAG: hypothetical protein KGL13_01745 [Gammaproteobacteria bacterium]|nr:hypothetical protein [Gammaproteobacteria bacterium]MDE2345168.1 hypothetical protein [Gammaproteobacteria bacterium]
MRRISLYLLICLLPAACTLQQTPVRTLQTTIPAADISSLALEVNVGAVTITPSADSLVHVSVGLKHNNSFFGIFNTGGNAAIKAAALTQESSNGVLKLGIRYPSNTDAGGVSEDWTLAVPAGMHISSHLNVGKLQVSGLSGGVEADLNIGKVALDLPSGAIKVSVNIGKITAVADTLNYGPVNLAASVGDAALRVNGKPAGDRQQQGSGKNVHYQGQGQEPISLSVNTGKVALDLKGK